MDDAKKGDAPNPLLFGIFFVAIIAILFTAIHSWYKEHAMQAKKDSPFYQVTNREFSLFLKENPRFLNTNVSLNEAFLPGTSYIKKISSNIQQADQLVNAPDKIIFEYHTWKRLIDYPAAPRLILIDPFKQFLMDHQEWLPENWKGAPKEYKALYHQIQDGKAPNNLSASPALPEDIREAFIGWKNYTFEQDEIKEFVPTFEQLKTFLQKYPNFERNFWINLVKETNPNYLETLSFEKYDPATKVPKDQIVPFLQIAIFNLLKAEQEMKTENKEVIPEPSAK